MSFLSDLQKIHHADKPSPTTAHPLRRSRRRRNRFPGQAEDMGKVFADRGHDHVQRLDLLACAGSTAFQGHGPDYAAGRCCSHWRVGSFGSGKQGQDCDEVRGGCVDVRAAGDGECDDVGGVD